MPRYFHLEPSLRAVGGHYHEYALRMMEAAENAGFQPVLATHRRFPGDPGFPKRWPIHPLFAHIVGGTYRVPREPPDRDLAWHAGRVLSAAWDQIKARFSQWRWYRNSTRRQGFAAACRELFRREPLRAGDVVHCATATDTELLGLLDFLRSDPATACASWNMQFHFRILRGRDPSHRHQMARLTPLGRQVGKHLASLPRHRLRFHATSEALARQFRRLDRMEVGVLDWPADRRFVRLDSPHEVPSAPKVAVAADVPPLPLRFLLAGAVRDEKGGGLLPNWLRQIDQALLRPGHAQFILQTAFAHAADRALLERIPSGLTSAICQDARQLKGDPAVARAAIVIVPHPLAPEDYAHLIQAADVGLLLYDTNEYFARCSGVLVEFLAAGVPVLGSAGCWLGDQIESLNQAQMRTCWGQTATSPSEARRSLPFLNAALRIGVSPWRKRIPIPSARPHGDILIRLHGLGEAEVGAYLRCSVRYHSAAGSSPRRTWLVGHIPATNTGDDADVYHHFRGPPSGTNWHSMEFEIAHAFPGQGEMPLEVVAWNLAGGDASSASIPVGTVGLTLADRSELLWHLQELHAHHAHYAFQTQRRATDWWQEHSPSSVFRKLLV